MAAAGHRAKEFVMGQKTPDLFCIAARRKTRPGEKISLRP
jgi:hypothetical protein